MDSSSSRDACSSSVAAPAGDWRIAVLLLVYTRSDRWPHAHHRSSEKKRRSSSTLSAPDHCHFCCAVHVAEDEAARHSPKTASERTEAQSAHTHRRVVAAARLACYLLLRSMAAPAAIMSSAGSSLDPSNILREKGRGGASRRGTSAPAAPLRRLAPAASRSHCCNAAPAINWLH
eukprot:COSAG01_NODE_10098_length_2251_cov_3.576208_1_plen_175_part_00